VSILLIIGQWGIASKPKPMDTVQTEIDHQS